MRCVRGGFTLIEMMISIAILAILMAIPYTTFNTFGALERERSLHDNLHSARLQLEAARQQPYTALHDGASLPELGEAHRVPAHAPYLISLVKAPASLVHVEVVHGEQRHPVPAHLESGQVVLPAECAGAVVVVDYVPAANANIMRIKPLPTMGDAREVTIEDTGRDARLRLHLSTVRVP